MATVQQFAASDIEKINLTTSNQKEITKMYKNLSKQAASRAKTLPTNGNISSALRKQYLDDYVKRVEKVVDGMTKALEQQTTNTMVNVAQEVVDANNQFMAKVGMKLEGAFSYVPENVVNRLKTGQVYKGNWNFSKALWQNGEKIKADMYSVVAQGIAGQKPTLEIAKDLEKYLNPSAKKDWNWSKVYPGVNTRVDYSAQRLARTLSQHAYQVALAETVKKNPFIEEIQWNSAQIHGRTCDLCRSRDGERYKKGEVPLDHPNGLCYFTVVLTKPLGEIADEIGNWYNGASNPALDAYYKDAMKGKVISLPSAANQLSNIPFDRTRVDNLLKQQSEGFVPGDLYIKDLEKINKPWAKSLTELEKESVFKYTYQWDQKMNSFKRGLTNVIDDETVKYMNALEGALSRAKLPKDVGLTRAADLKSLFNMTGLTKDAKAAAGGMKGWLTENYQNLIGKVAEDKAFISTSAKASGGLLKTKAGSVKYKILAPKGTNGMYIAPQSRFHYEDEVLLQAGQRFIIKDVAPPAGKIKDWTVYLEILV